MKTVLFLLLAVFTASTMGFAKDAAHPTPEMDPKKKEMMEAWMKYATPSGPHKMLGSMAGRWTYKSKFWETPKSAPEESKGTSAFKMVLGGRFLQHTTKGKAMGMPFEGIGFTGYNNIQEKYETLWLDSMGTGMMLGKGDYNAETKTLSDRSEATCPMAKNKNKTREFRSDWKIIDKNNMIFSMFGPDEDDDEFKMMEIVYTRAK